MVARQTADFSQVPVDMTNANAFYIMQGSYIDAARDEAVEEYGSMENCIRDGLGSEDRLIERLRAELFEP